MRSLRKTFITLFSTALMFVSTVALSSCGTRTTIDGIEITTPPTRTDYVKGETFDPTGMVVSVVYSNGDSEALSAGDYTYSPNGKLSTTTTRITVTYRTDEGNFTARQSIKVHNDVVGATKTSDPDKVTYLPGEIFDPTGMIVTLTYEDNTTKEINITKDNAIYKTDELTAEDTVVTVKYLTYTFDVEITMIPGLFIEAETGIIEANDPAINGDADGVDEKHQATGGKYVGNLFAGDSITFLFDSDSEGTVDIAFRLASLYFKEADPNDEWTPVWMGDVQFNKLCDFTVNDVKYNIPDDAILPGGGEEHGVPDNTLWFNWEEVAFQNISVIKGQNRIKLTFKTHDYMDTQHGSWAGRFAANVDSLKIMAHDCTISAYTFKYEINNVALAVENNKAVLTVGGTYIKEGYTERDEDMIANRIAGPLVLQANPSELRENPSWEGDWQTFWFDVNEIVISEEEGVKTFGIKFIISDRGRENKVLYPYAYTAHFGGESSEYDLKPAMDYFGERSIEVTNVNDQRLKYTLVYDSTKNAIGNDPRFWGCIGIIVETL